jgi:ATP-dependent Clp protease ATP-binding subunit ClpC
MFERYTEKARRVIFFARYEASQFGSPYIETEHLLLGLLREDKALTNRFLRSHATVESIRKQIESRTTIREVISTSVDLPLSDDCKRVLAYATEEAERLSHRYVGTEHLLLGLLREERTFSAEILKERGLQLDAVRENIVLTAYPSTGANPSGSTSLPDMFRDLTQAAVDGKIEPLVGRDLELESVIEICCSFQKKNPLLVGGTGVGKTAIVEGLAQRIAEGKVPPSLAGKRILAIPPEQVAGWARDRPGFEQLTKWMNADTILFLDEFQDFFAWPSRFGTSDGARIIRYALVSAGIPCIVTGNASDYQGTTQTSPWFRKFFRVVHVRPLDGEGTVQVLRARRSRLESFYEVTYADEALELAAHSAGSYLPGSELPGKAIELLDAVGSLVRLRKTAPPAEIADIEARLKFIIQRMENSIANHEFEKARFYSEEERKEREKLRVLREQHPESPSAVVGPDEVKEVISRWGIYPYCP